MIALKLVRLIEAHSEELSLGLTQKILSSGRTKDYRKLPEHEMRAGALEIYQYLSDWLLTKTDSDIELRYTRLGELRAQQGISLSHFVWAIALTKEHLWGFLRREALLDRVIELFGELELLQLLDRFFDNALYYASVSYQKTQDRRKAA
jgi:hypothetical protein